MTVVLFFCAIGISMISQFPRIALAQMEVIPARPDLNFTRMCRFIDAAREQRVQVLAFPEMCLSGYILGDLWEVDTVVKDFAAYSQRVCDISQGLTLVFGNVAVDPQQIGEDGRLRKFNAALVCHDGQFVGRPDLPPGLPLGCQAKTLHPDYRYFDDDRHFYSLRKLAVARGRELEDYQLPFCVPWCDDDGQQQRFSFGVQLCEDIWFQDYRRRRQVMDTCKPYRAHGAQAMFNLSASPWSALKNSKRNRVIHDALVDSPMPFYYINQVGAQNNGKNILVFDGDTCAYAANGEVVCRARAWEEQLLLTESGVVSPALKSLEDIHQGIVAGIRHLDRIRGQQNRYLIGVSGGVDSAVVTSLLCAAVGAERVFAVNMPSRFNSGRTRDNAAMCCESLGIPLLVCPIQELYERLAKLVAGAEFPGLAGDYSGLVDENLQARIRGADILAGLSAKLGLIYTNNGNKTETALGYATLYGDVNGAIAPIADLYKPQVFALARYLNDEVFKREVIAENLLSGETVPSAELSGRQDVEQGLGDPIKYGYHDAVLRQFIEYRKHPYDLLLALRQGQLFSVLEWEQRQQFLDYFSSTQAWLEDLDWLWRQLRVNVFKRIQAPPIIVLSKRAFGFDLRESQLPSYEPAVYKDAQAELAVLDLTGLV